LRSRCLLVVLYKGAFAELTNPVASATAIEDEGGFEIAYEVLGTRL
jgi:hypothetical protein